MGPFVMSITLHTQAPAGAAATTAAAMLRGSQPQTADGGGTPFGDTLAQTVGNATMQAPTAGPNGSTMQTTGSQYLHAKTADHDTLHSGKPDTATFMKATGADFATASSLLYGVVGSNTDYRDWNAIMAAADQVQAARQATGALYNSDLPYTSGTGFKPSAAQTVAASGNFAWLEVDQREGLWLMNNQGEALRQIPVSAPDILRNARDFGFDTGDLAALADQMDARGVAYAPGKLYAGSNHGVDLRDLARGGMGAAYDWTSDPLAHLKGPGAQAAVAANAQLARELGLSPTGTSGKASTLSTSSTSSSAGTVGTAGTTAATTASDSRVGGVRDNTSGSAGSIDIASPSTQASEPRSTAEQISNALVERLLAQLQAASGTRV